MNAALKMMLAAKTSEQKMEQGGGNSMNYARYGEGNMGNGAQGNNRGESPRMEYGNRMEYGGNRMAYEGGSRMEYAEGRGNRMGFDGARSEYGAETNQANAYNRMGEDPNMGYAESKFRDRRGRPHYENGRYAPRSEMQNDAEGRYSEPSMHFGYLPHQEKAMIGFYSGQGNEEEVEPLNQFSAEKWTHSMKGAEGEKGPHWNLEKIKQIKEQKDVDCDLWEFYAAMNAMYSDYSKMLKKYGLGDNVDFYIDMAKAFIDDPDAQPEKMARYFKYIVKH